MNWERTGIYVSDLRALRKRAGLSTRSLARLLGTSEAHVVRVERGEEKPRCGLLRAWGESLGLTDPQIAHLMEDAQQPDWKAYQQMVRRYEWLLKRDREAAERTVQSLREELQQLRNIWRR